MGLQTPKLDDRAFNDIVEEARRRIQLYTPEWTDHNLSDPGITLIELFAWMTDIVLYRLNRVPDKHFIKFMELIGMELAEATPARVPITFWLSSPRDTTQRIPAGTEISTTRTETEEAIVFTTDGDLEILVPDLRELMTSSTNAEGGRVFQSHNIFNVKTGFEGFPVFASETPSNDDALYLGFAQDLSDHVIGVELSLPTAEGAGINPEKPPYVWEVMSADLSKNWIKAEVESDDTLALSRTGMVRLHLPPMRRETRDRKTAFWVRLRLNVGEDEVGYDNSPVIEQMNVYSWGGTVTATNVSRAYEEVVGRSDGSPGQRFYLEHSPLVARTQGENIVVRVDRNREEPWQEVSDFSSSSAKDKHYTIDSETGEIRFGPAIQTPDGQVQIFGDIPPKDALIIMSRYRYGGGQVGNVAARTINVLKSSIPYIGQVRNLEPARGGQDAETLEHAKMRVPGYLRSLNRAVTASDYEYLATQAAAGEVGRVYCLQTPLTDRGEIRVLVIPKVPVLRGFISPESLRLSPELRTTIQEYLDERRLLATRLYVSEPTYHWVQTDVRLRVADTYDPEKVRQRVENKLFDFLNPLIGGFDGKGWQFGRDLFVADITSALLTVEGVSFIRSVTLYPSILEDGQFRPDDETDMIPVSSQGVIVSNRHNIEMI